MDKPTKNDIMGVDNVQCQIRREQTDVLAQRGLGNSDLIGRLMRCIFDASLWQPVIDRCTAKMQKERNEKR